jgi:hypothetical protein
LLKCKNFFNSKNRLYERVFAKNGVSKMGLFDQYIFSSGFLTTLWTKMIAKNILISLIYVGCHELIRLVDECGVELLNWSANKFV